MPWTRDQMAARAARELRDGFYVNLGIGIPTLVSNFIPEGMSVQLQSENGMLGTGPFPFEGEEDPDLINAGKQTVTELPTTSYFSSADSFGMIRGGHIDLAILGAMQVSEKGDLANWNTGDPATAPAVGGAMDLAVGAKAIRVLMDHVTKDGKPRILSQCRYPLTAAHCVKAIYTSHAVMDVTPNGLVVRETIPDLDFAQLQAMTEAKLTLSPDWRVIDAPPLAP